MQPLKVSIIELIPAQAPEVDELEQTLSKSGVVVNRVTYTQNILDSLNELQSELIFIVPANPLTSSMELVHLFQGYPAYLNVPIIFFTTNEKIIKQVSAITLEGASLLIPPIEPYSLVASVKASILRSRFIHAQVIHDNLTGLLNQSATIEHLNLEIARAKRENTSLSVAMLDIDHFKKINDTHGHLKGNQVIKTLANVLTKRLRKSDSIGRYGGDEFLLILPNTQASIVLELLTEIKNRFLECYLANKTESLAPTFSAGVAHLLPDLGSSTELIQTADKALYQAKHQGRNQIVIASNARHST